MNQHQGQHFFIIEILQKSTNYDFVFQRTGYLLNMKEVRAIIPAVEMREKEQLS